MEKANGNHLAVKDLNTGFSMVASEEILGVCPSRSRPHRPKYQSLQVRRAVTPPQAPTSAAVAKQILYHASAVPLKRFDSADFELQKFKASQLAHPTSVSPRTECEGRTPLSKASEDEDELQRPPPIQLGLEERLAIMIKSPHARSPAALTSSSQLCGARRS